MKHSLSNSLFLVTLLSSSNEKLLKLSYNSIINQTNHYLNYTILIVVNTLDNSYFQKVQQEFENINVEIIQTESNGYPGMGHNSLFDIFRNKIQYDYLIPIDGDDFLYPFAFSQLSKVISKHNPDILVLQGNDILSWYNDSDSTTDIYLNNCFYLVKQDEYPQNKWILNNTQININPFTSDSFITPVRNILCSRNILNFNIKNFYCPNCKVIDDYLFYLHFINFFITKQLNVFIINSNHIYLYNDISTLSAHYNNTLKYDYDFIKSYKNTFTNIIKHYENIWNVLDLPFLYIDPPYDDIYNNYKIVKNNVQIINYNTYLSQSNTKYCIDFCSKLVIEIYNTFKYNIDYWLSTNDNKYIVIAYNLCEKLINNGITDREIFMYICICTVLLKKKIIPQYIENSKPLCYNQPCLLKYL